MSLRWERQSWGGIYAYSGSRRIAMIGQRTDLRSWWVSFDGVNVRWTSPRMNTTDYVSAAAAKRAIERAWLRWLEAAQLAPIHSN